MSKTSENSMYATEQYYEEMAKLAQSRVSEKRFQHMQGVAHTAALLAEEYGEDVKKARLAGILHDWDKSLTNTEIREKVRSLGISEEVGEWVVRNMPQVLHGPTAAKELGQLFPELPQDVLNAIQKHTIAAIEMTPLDKILYIADAIEPSRTFPEAPDLRNLIGIVTLDQLYFEVYRFWTMALVSSNALLHPDTLTIWNNIVYPQAHARLQKYEKRTKEK